MRARELLGPFFLWTVLLVVPTACGSDDGGESGVKAIIDCYHQGFDVTQDVLSVQYVSRPTRGLFESAFYLGNPMLIDDVSSEDDIVPSPLPTFEEGAARYFYFPGVAGSSIESIEVLDSENIFDSLPKSKITTSDSVEAVHWVPAVSQYLLDKYASDGKDLPLYEVLFAIEGQKWGGHNTYPAQTIQRLFLDDQGAPWIEVVFAPFVQLDSSVTDSDGDGFREIFARLNLDLQDPDVSQDLSDYMSSELDESDLRALIAPLLNKLYFKAPMTVINEGDRAFEVAGCGIIEKPFVVIQRDAPLDDYQLVIYVEF